MPRTRSAKIIELDDTNTCELCDNALAKYTCPKCEIKYCSLECYRTDKHLECSEEFYKDCVSEELRGKNDERRILEILEKNRLGGDSDEELDSDDDVDIGDIAERLAGVDLDDADEIWEKLTKDEQQEFVAFLKSEDVTKLIPSWEPWWSHVSKNVEEVESSNLYKNDCPSVVKIKNFNEISKKAPASCVKYNLINVMAAYAFTARYFNGEHHDFCREVVTCVVTISQCLKNNQNFEDFENAVKSVEYECTESDWILADAENFKLLRSDLDKILGGPNATDKNFYVLCALSDLHHLLNLALNEKKGKETQFSKNFPNDHFPDVKLESKNKIRSCLRKTEYLLSYAKEFPL